MGFFVAMNNVAVEHPLAVGLLSVPAWVAVHLIGGALSRRFLRPYAELTRQAQAEWCNRVCSSLHAIIMVVACLAFLLSHSFYLQPYDPRGRLNSLDLLWLISLGYTAYDLVHWAQFYKHYGPAIAVHHVVMFFAVYGEVQTHYQTFIACLLMVTECSTPVLNARWYLQRYNVRDGPVLAANGGLLVFSYLFGRILPTILALVLQLRTVVCCHDQQGALENVGFTLVTITFVVLNLYWFKIIAAKAYKLFCTSGGDKRRESAESGGAAGDGDASPAALRPNETGDAEAGLGLGLGTGGAVLTGLYGGGGGGDAHESSPLMTADD